MITMESTEASSRRFGPVAGFRFPAPAAGSVLEEPIASARRGGAPVAGRRVPAPAAGSRRPVVMAGGR
jgi:hypothetical protein